MNIKELEKENLNATIDAIESVIEEELKTLESFQKDFIGTKDDLFQRIFEKEIHIKNIKSTLDCPYFARINFTTTTDNIANSYYIGKHGVSQGSNIIVTDWRAPVSSLYYDAILGDSSYDSPSGIIYGRLSLKRQFEIEKGILLNYHDVDLVSNDALLQKYLNSNNDNRLKSIVATIQKEQNDVIRKKLFENLIIQGVAGSGKTTVALHRIAYLVYNYMKSIHQNQYLVIGPNPVFLKYIKQVLPELDVTGISQLTFEKFAINFIDENINITSSENKAAKNIAGRINNDIDKFKSSIKYKGMLDVFLSSFIDSITENDLTINGFLLIKRDIIKTIFDNTNKEFSLDNRIEQTITKLTQNIKGNIGNILTKYSDYATHLFESEEVSTEKDKLRKQFVKDREEIKKYCKSTIRKYFSKAKTDTTKIYKSFLNTITDFNIFDYENIDLLKKETLKNLKNNIYDFEDLSALIYIKSRINPNNKYREIRHAVIDEAQDLGEFNFYILKQVLPNATFSIFGDLAQSIYDYRGIDNWEQVNFLMFNNDASIIKFTKSYRTTSEIMQVADNVAQYLGLSKSDLVVRRGNDVNIKCINSEEEIISYIIKRVEYFKQKGYKTIAIISKTDLLSQYLNDALREKGLIIPNVTINDDLTKDEFNICTISNQLAKGLEFDAVIINNASEEIYSSNNTLDMKLLYVAITRALHELDIIYTKDLTKPLKYKQNSLDNKIINS